MKYTLDQLKDNENVVVFLENQLQWNALKQLDIFKMTNEYLGSFCYDLYDSGYCSNSTKTYSGAYKRDTIVLFEEIEFDTARINNFLADIGCPFKEGDILSGKIDNTFYSDMKLHIEEDKVFLLQNYRNGLDCENKQGYDYSYCIFDNEDDWEAGLDQYEIYDLEISGNCKSCELNQYDTSKGLPKYFYLEFTTESINKLLDLFPKSQAQNQFNRYGRDSSYGYIGRSEDYPNFEIDDRSFFKTKPNCQFLTEEEFFACLYEEKLDFLDKTKEQKILCSPYQISESTEVKLTSFSKITNKKSKQITKLFKF